MTASVSALLGASGQPCEIHQGGKVFQARPITQTLKSAYERWLIDRAMAPFLAASVGAGDRRAAMEFMAERIDSGHYGFHGDFAQKSLQTHDGSMALTRLILDCSDLELMTLMAEKKDETLAVIDLVIRESFPAIADEAPDPNERTPT